MPSAELVVGQYKLLVVIASFLVSMTGSFVALGAAADIRKPDGRLSLFSLCSAALSLGGVGIWCMHFIGMTAFKLPVHQSYAIAETVISFVAAVLVSGLAFWFLARQAFSLARLFIAGTVVGLAVAVMHYLGMYGIRFTGYVAWDGPLVGLSIFIAVTAATAALWLAFHTRRLAHRFLASVAMAAAVGTMHYTGMAAASFYCRTNVYELAPWGTISLDYLGELVFMVALILCGWLLLDQIWSRQLEEEPAPRRRVSA